jgi:hypothetical protein
VLGLAGFVLDFDLKQSGTASWFVPARFRTCFAPPEDALEALRIEFRALPFGPGPLRGFSLSRLGFAVIEMQSWST